MGAQSCEFCAGVRSSRSVAHAKDLGEHRAIIRDSSQNGFPRLKLLTGTGKAVSQKRVEIKNKDCSIFIFVGLDFYFFKQGNFFKVTVNVF